MGPLTNPKVGAPPPLPSPPALFFPTVPIPCQPKPTMIMFFSSTPRRIIISLMSSILRGESPLLKNKNLSCQKDIHLQCFTFSLSSPFFFFPFFSFFFTFSFFSFFSSFLLGPLPGPLSPRAPRICLGCLGLVAPLGASKNRNRNRSGMKRGTSKRRRCIYRRLRVLTKWNFPEDFGFVDTFYRRRAKMKTTL